MKKQHLLAILITMIMVIGLIPAIGLADTPVLAAGGVKERLTEEDIAAITQRFNDMTQEEFQRKFPTSLMTKMPTDLILALTLNPNYKIDTDDMKRILSNLNDNEVQQILDAFDYEIPEPPAPIVTREISGKVTGYDNAEAEAIVELILGGEVIKTVKTSADHSFKFTDVSDGVYTLRVSKDLCVARDYAVTVAGGDVVQNAELYIAGDADLNGECDIFDLNLLFNQISGDGKDITDEYALKCADVNGDGDLDVFDLRPLFEKI